MKLLVFQVLFLIISIIFILFGTYLKKEKVIIINSFMDQFNSFIAVSPLFISLIFIYPVTVYNFYFGALPYSLYSIYLLSKVIFKNKLKYKLYYYNTDKSIVLDAIKDNLNEMSYKYNVDKFEISIMKKNASIIVNDDSVIFCNFDNLNPIVRGFKNDLKKRYTGITSNKIANKYILYGTILFSLFIICSFL